MSIAVIILAAGSSSRLGQSKQLLAINNEAMLRKICKNAINSRADNVIVVLGAEQAQHRKVIDDLGLTIVFNEEWRKGMGSSIKKGLHHLIEEKTDSRAVIISVCDQPLLHDDIFDQLIELHKKYPNRIIASSYKNTFGVPVLFGSKWYGDLLKIEDSAGAKQVVLENMNEVTPLPFHQGGLDIDTPDDLKMLNELLIKANKDNH